MSDIQKEYFNSIYTDTPPDPRVQGADFGRWLSTFSNPFVRLTILVHFEWKLTEKMY